MKTQSKTKKVLDNKKATKPKPKLGITATVFHLIRQESYYEVKFNTVDGQTKKLLIGRELFRKPTRVVDALLRAHAALPDDDDAAIKLVKKLFQQRASCKFA